MKNGNISLEVPVISITRAFLQVMCRLGRIHPGWVCFAKLALLLYKNWAEEQAIQDLFVWAGWNRRSCTKAASAQAGLDLEQFCYDGGTWGCRGNHTTGASGWGLGSNGVTLLHLRAAENISLSMNPLTLGVSDKKAPRLRTKPRYGGLFCFVALICFAVVVVELVIELLGSSAPALRHGVVQPKSLWEPVEAEAVLQPCEVRET